MKIKRRSFPHPVVGNGDDVNAGFQAPLVVKRVEATFEFEVHSQMSSGSLLKLIEDGGAEYALHIECSKTYYRELISLDQRNGVAVASTKAENLGGSVEVNVVIIATRDMPDYQLDGFHQDYSGAEFFVSRGDLLAISEGHQFDADIQSDQLEAVDSIMEIHRRHDSLREIGLDLNGDKILVLLPEDQYETYSRLNGDGVFNAIAISSLVLPVLMEALDIFSKDEEVELYQDKRWYRNLKLRLARLRLDSGESKLLCAQRLLENPLSTTLVTYQESLSLEVEDD